MVTSHTDMDIHRDTGTLKQYEASLPARVANLKKYNKAQKAAENADQEENEAWDRAWKENREKRKGQDGGARALRARPLRGMLE